MQSHVRGGRFFGRIRCAILGPETGSRSRRARWWLLGSPAVLLVSVLATSVAILLTINAKDSEKQVVELDEDIRWAQIALTRRLEDNARLLPQLVKDETVTADPSSSSLLRAAEHVRSHPELLNVAWLDASLHPKAFAIPDGSRQELLARLSGEGAIKAKTAANTGEVIYGEPFPGVDGSRLLDVWIPVFQGEQIEGLIAGLYNVDSLIDQGIPSALFRAYEFELLGSTAVAHEPDESESTLSQKVAVECLPGCALSGERRSISPVETSLFLLTVLGVILAGILVAVVLRLTTLAERYRTRARAGAADNRFLHAIIDGFSEGIVVADKSGKLVMTNTLASSLVGVECGPDDQRVWAQKEWPARFGLRRPQDGKLYEADEFPLARALRGESVTEVETFIAHERVPDGLYLRANASAVHTESGEIVGAVLAFRDVSEERLVNQEILEARREALESNQAKSVFLSYMSHEIRTPMSSILGYSELLYNDGGNAKVMGYAESIQQNGRELLGVLDDILDLAKIESNIIELEKKPCSPFDIVHDAMTRAKAEADRLNVPISVEYRGPVPKLMTTDPDRAAKVLADLFDVVMTQPEAASARIAVSLLGAHKGYDSYLSVEFLDTKLSLDQEELGSLYHSYAKADAATMLMHGKSGLRLAVAQRFVQMLGGDLLVRTKASGINSLVVRIATGSLVGIELEDKSTNSTSAVAGVGALPTARLEGVRVLLADDDPCIHRLVEWMLSSAGAEVSIAQNGLEAAEKASRDERLGRPFDVVLMDMRMPVLSGTEATERIRCAGFDGTIIGLTASSHPKEQATFHAAGGDRFLAKPFEKEQLIEVIFDCLAGEAASDAPTASTGDTHPLVVIVDDGEVEELRGTDTHVISKDGKSRLRPKKRQGRSGSATELLRIGPRKTNASNPNPSRRNSQGTEVVRKGAAEAIGDSELERLLQPSIHPRETEVVRKGGVRAAGNPKTKLIEPAASTPRGTEVVRKGGVPAAGNPKTKRIEPAADTLRGTEVVRQGGEPAAGSSKAKPVERSIKKARGTEVVRKEPPRSGATEVVAKPTARPQLRQGVTPSREVDRPANATEAIRKKRD